MPKVIAAILLLQSGGVDSSEPPTVTAVRVDRAPVVDGRLDDPEWSLAPAVTDFRQTDPDEGAPVSEATAVRVLYDGTAVYVGARLFDSAPARIVRRALRALDRAEAGTGPVPAHRQKGKRPGVALRRPRGHPRRRRAEAARAPALHGRTGHVPRAEGSWEPFRAPIIVPLRRGGGREVRRELEPHARRH